LFASCLYGFVIGGFVFIHFYSEFSIIYSFLHGIPVISVPLLFLNTLPSGGFLKRRRLEARPIEEKLAELESKAQEAEQ